MRLPPAALVPALMLLPGAALAHSPIKGLDAFYTGFLHPVFVPAHVLTILALGILIGQQGVKSLQVAVVAFLVATSLGLVATAFPIGVAVQSPLLLLAAAAGVAVALARPLPRFVYATLAVAIGLMLGADSAQDELAGRSRFGALLGTGVAAYLLLLYAMAFAEWFGRRDWQRIGLRVIGSWTAASAFLVLALLLAR